MRWPTTLVLFLTLACSGSGSDGTASRVDGALDPLPDAAPHVETVVTCDDYTWTAQQQPSGQREVYVYKRALVDGVLPQDDYVVVACHAPDHDALRPECPFGYACTGSAGPVGQTCHAVRDSRFVGGKLLVECGSTYTLYDAQDQVVRSSSNVFESVRLIRR